MKHLLQLVVALSLLSSCSAPPKPTPHHPFVSKAKEISLYADRIDWEKVNAEFTKLMEEEEEPTAALQYLLNSLGDKHAAIRSAKDHAIVVSYAGANIEEDNRDPEVVNTVINDVSATFSHQLLDEGIGYLKVVGIGPGDVKAQADAIRKGLSELDQQGVDQWIVDLRFNGGGNIEPMIAGLAPLIGEGFIGGAINRAGEIRDYTIKNNQFYNYDRLVCDMEAASTIKAEEKVAVLLSRYTISSGELLAVAFKGRDQTLFIGEETAGYTTGNSYEQLNEDLVLVISENVFIDRNKTRYDNNVGVDETMVFQPSVDLAQDAQVLRAKAWLNE